MRRRYQSPFFRPIAGPYHPVGFFLVRLATLRVTGNPVAGRRYVPITPCRNDTARIYTIIPRFNRYRVRGRCAPTRNVRQRRSAATTAAAAAAAADGSQPALGGNLVPSVGRRSPTEGRSHRPPSPPPSTERFTSTVDVAQHSL